MSNIKSLDNFCDIIPCSKHDAKTFGYYIFHMSYM